MSATIPQLESRPTFGTGRKVVIAAALIAAFAAGTAAGQGSTPGPATSPGGRPVAHAQTATPSHVPQKALVAERG